MMSEKEEKEKEEKVKKSVWISEIPAGGKLTIIYKGKVVGERQG